MQAALDEAVDRARDSGLSLREILEYVRTSDALRRYLDSTTCT